MAPAKVLELLAARFGSAVEEALVTAETWHPDRAGLDAVVAPVLRNAPDAGWLRRANVVGINMRTVGGAWGVIPYSLTVPAVQGAIHVLPFLEPGVVGSLYGPASWEVDTGGRGAQRADHPQWDQDGVHDIYRAWWTIADSYPDPRVFVGEVHAATPERLARYLRPGELQAAFNLAFLKSAWDVGAIRAVIDSARSAHSAVGAMPMWVLSNHDETRHVTRFGRRDTDVPLTPRPGPDVTDLDLGTRRGRAAALLMLGLPGSACIYQGEELGLPEVEDLPAEALRDPVWARSGGRLRGRDGCRVPLPWSGGEAPFGFGPPDSVPWLPQPRDWGRYSVESQEADLGSMLMLYRDALRIRREHAGFAGEAFRWIDAPTGVLAFECGSGVRCVVNLAGEPMPLLLGRTTLLRSEALHGDLLPAGAAIWDAAGSADR